MPTLTFSGFSLSGGTGVLIPGGIAVPPGVWTSAEWSFAGSISGPAGSYSLSVVTPVHSVGLPVASIGTLPTPYQGAATPAQLADINAAAGGTLSVGVLASAGSETFTITGGSLTLYGYCSNTGTFTLSGKFTRTSEAGISHENVPLTLFVKQCSPPGAKPCAHQPTSGPGSPAPGAQYCADGSITAQYTTTACDGSYSFTVNGSTLAIGLAIGHWVSNPDFSCAAIAPGVGGSGENWLLYIPDAETQIWYNCGFGLSASGTALTPPSPIFAEFIEDALGGLTDATLNSAVSPCGPIAGGQICLGCQQVTGCILLMYAGGVTGTYPDYIADILTGSYTFNFWDSGQAEVFTYYLLDGKYYTVRGVEVTVKDVCGNSETITTVGAGAGGFTQVDWYNLSSVSIGNWTTDCSPPIGVDFSGPAGGMLFINGPYAALPVALLTDISPTLPSMTPYCMQREPILGAPLQEPCIGTVADRLAADTLGGVLAVAWISSGALKTAVHRSPARQIGSSTAGWEATDVVEATDADQIAMTFLPNESLYLTYYLSGVAKYRLNKSFGANGKWLAAASPNPVVGGPGACGRGQEQAFRFQAQGSFTANGAIAFSQCRDNRGAEWTAPVVVTPNAAGPYCGGIFVENLHGCLFTPATSVSGSVAAGSLYWTQSTDGGATWSAPVFTGFGGGILCNGIVRTRQGVLVAVVWDPTAHTTAFLVSRNGGQGWQSVTRSTPVPALTIPPVLAAIGDLVFVIWVTGEQPQFLCSQDSGITFH